VRVVATRLVPLLCLVLLTGCVTTGALDPAAEPEITGLVQTWKAAVEAKDPEAVMALYADDFKSEETPNKKALRDYFNRIGTAGWLEGIEVDVSEVQVEQAGWRYKAAPLNIRGKFAGTISYTLYFARVDGTYKIVSSESSGM
jgi:ketosteroid isomerase-like protein